MKVIKTKLPAASLLFINSGKYDYTDSFECIIDDRENRIKIIDIAEVFVQPGPAWFEKLMSLRHKIVSVFGLKTAENPFKDHSEKYKWEPGEQTGIFEVYKKTPNEIILGGDDKHLNVRVSLLMRSADGRTEKVINVSTLVELNNLLGRVYFFIIKPFHRIIVPVLLKKDLVKLETGNNSFK